MRLAAVERELARLRTEHTEHAAPDEPAPAPPPVPSPEEERRRVAARFAELERQLLAEPADPAWSSGAMELLQNDLGAIARRDGFELTAVECRTTMCRATVRWDSFAAAVKTGMHLPELATPGLNCAKGIWLEEPGDPLESYSSSLFLDCSAQRAETIHSPR